MSTKKTTYSALEVGLYFLYLANKAGKKITNKKMQKLVYYAQAWSLVVNNKKLFADKIEAWVHGPAVRSLYVKYREFGFNPIIKDVNQQSVEMFLAKDKKLMNEVWDLYGSLDAGYLEMLTHSEAPWQEAREGLQNSESSNSEISPKIMKKFYSEKLEEAKK
jgi:uncharacterized phage-associated protein